MKILYSLGLLVLLISGASLTPVQASGAGAGAGCEPTSPVLRGLDSEDDTPVTLPPPLDLEGDTGSELDSPQDFETSTVLSTSASEGAILGPKENSSPLQACDKFTQRLMADALGLRSSTPHYKTTEPLVSHDCTSGGHGFTSQFAPLFRVAISLRRLDTLVEDSFMDHIAEIKNHSRLLSYEFDTLIECLEASYEEGPRVWNIDAWNSEKSKILEIPALKAIDSAETLFELAVALMRFDAQLMSLSFACTACASCPTNRLGNEYSFCMSLANALPVVTFALAAIYQEKFGLPLMETNDVLIEETWMKYADKKSTGCKASRVRNEEGDSRIVTHSIATCIDGGAEYWHPERESVLFESEDLFKLIDVNGKGAAWVFYDKEYFGVSKEAHQLRTDFAISYARRWAAYAVRYRMISQNPGLISEYKLHAVANGLIW